MIYKQVHQEASAFNHTQNLRVGLCNIHDEVLYSKVPQVFFVEENFPERCSYIHYNGKRCMDNVDHRKDLYVIEANGQYDEYQRLLDLQLKLLNITRHQLDNFLRFSILLLSHFSEKVEKQTNNHIHVKNIKMFRTEETYLREKFFGFFDAEDYQFKTPAENMDVLTTTNIVHEDLQLDILTNQVNDFLRSIILYYLLISGYKNDKSFLSSIVTSFQNTIGPITLAKDQRNNVPVLHPMLRLQYDKFGWVIMKDLKYKYENLEDVFIDQ